MVGRILALFKEKTLPQGSGYRDIIEYRDLATNDNPEIGLPNTAVSTKKNYIKSIEEMFENRKEKLEYD